MSPFLFVSFCNWVQMKQNLFFHFRDKAYYKVCKKSKYMMTH